MDSVLARHFRYETAHTPKRHDKTICKAKRMSSLPSSTADFEYLKLALAFFGTLFGAMIGTPFIDWCKDKIGARRSWETQRNEIIATIRLILGLVQAFREIQKAAFEGPTGEVSSAALKRLQKFDFKLFDDSLMKLSALHPEESSQSAAAQRLIQHLVVAKLHLEQVQDISPVAITKISATPVRILENGRPTFIPDKPNCLSIAEEDQKIIQSSDDAYVALTRFLSGIYAPRLGIEPMSLILDKEIIEFEHKMSEYDRLRQQQILEDALTEYRRLRDSE